MSLENLKKEVHHEMEAVKKFITLAIEAQRLGHFKAVEFYLSQAQEDCHHALKYAIALDKHNQLEGNLSISQTLEVYQQMELDATKRVNDIIGELHSTPEHMTLMPFALEMLNDHSNEAYTAKKALQKVSVLEKQEALNDIEEIFEELLDGEDEN